MIGISFSWAVIDIRILWTKSLYELTLSLSYDKRGRCLTASVTIRKRGFGVKPPSFIFLNICVHVTSASWGALYKPSFQNNRHTKIAWRLDPFVLWVSKFSCHYCWYYHEIPNPAPCLFVIVYDEILFIWNLSYEFQWFENFEFFITKALQFLSYLHGYSTVLPTMNIFCVVLL